MDIKLFRSSLMTLLFLECLAFFLLQLSVIPGQTLEYTCPLGYGPPIGDGYSFMDYADAFVPTLSQSSDSGSYTILTCDAGTSLGYFTVWNVLGLNTVSDNAIINLALTCVDMAGSSNIKYLEWGYKTIPSQKVVMDQNNDRLKFSVLAGPFNALNWIRLNLVDMSMSSSSIYPGDGLLTLWTTTGQTRTAGNTAYTGNALNCPAGQVVTGIYFTTGVSTFGNWNFITYMYPLCSALCVACNVNYYCLGNTMQKIVLLALHHHLDQAHAYVQPISFGVYLFVLHVQHIHTLPWVLCLNPSASVWPTLFWHQEEPNVFAHDNFT